MNRIFLRRVSSAVLSRARVKRLANAKIQHTVCFVSAINITDLNLRRQLWRSFIFLLLVSACMF